MQDSDRLFQGMSKETLQDLIDALPFYVMVIDSGHIIRLVNAFTLETFNAEAEHLIGQRCTRIVHGCAWDFPGCPLEEAIKRGGSVERELWDPASGEWFKSSIHPLPGRDGEQLFLHFSRNISAEKTNERELRSSAELHAAVNSLLRAAQEAPNTVALLEFVAENILGISWLKVKNAAAAFLAEGDHLRMVWSRNIHPDILKSCAEVPTGRCLCGRAAASGKVLIRDHVDSDHDISYPSMEDHGHIVIPLRQGDVTLGALTFYLEAGRTLNDKERLFIDAAASIVKAAFLRLDLQSQLLQADRLSSLGVLAAGVAHEVNNPLTYMLYNLGALSENLEILKQQGEALWASVEAALGKVEASQLQAQHSPELRAGILGEMGEMLADAELGAKRMSEIMRDLKTLSSGGSGKSERVSVNEVLESVFNIAFNEIKHRARLVKNLGQLPQINANEGRLAQVFLNLLINAAHAIGDGDPASNSVQVSTGVVDGMVSVSVSDTGCGMKAADLGRIFQPFYTTKERGVGTGLGLAISARIIKEMGGKIAVRSELGVGSMFTVHLPM